MTADRTAALEAIDKALYPNHTTQWPFDALKLSRSALLATAKESDRMREALGEMLKARDDMMDFLIGRDPKKVGESAWRIEHGVLTARQEAAYRKGRAILPSEGTKS